MSWIIEGVWASHDGKSFMADMSAIDHDGGMRKVFLPGISEPLSHFKWTEKRDDEGEIIMWKAVVYGKSLAIFND
ncbi:hypothetical protein LCGC14_1314910 [marine sediment metagenome]|uniref:Uncharacterized protein n=1 Tax=marine sediment metagenome TaxID=412755 RepID=A0A0F9N256_9ZZZZ